MEERLRGEQSMSSEAHKRAWRKHDAKRPRPISVRFSAQDLEALHAARSPDETLSQCVRRLIYERLH